MVRRAAEPTDGVSVAGLLPDTQLSCDVTVALIMIIASIRLHVWLSVVTNVDIYKQQTESYSLQASWLQGEQVQ